MRLILLTALAIAAFAGNSVLNRLAVGGGQIGAADFAGVRLVAGAVALLALVQWRARARGVPVWPGTRGRAVGSAALLVYLFGFSLAYGGLDAGAGALILFGMVQVTMFAGALIAREAVPARRWIGAGLALAGLAGLMAPGAGGGISPAHAAFMAVAGVGWGVYSLSARGQTDALAATAWNFALAVPGGLALVWLLRGTEAVTAAGVWLAVVSGVVTSGLGYALWYAVLPRLGAARAGVAQLTVPVIAAAGGAVLLAEPVTLRFVLAALVVLGGVALALSVRRA
jgi:drug/metabolite transporter (DMT)-like permease